MKKVLLVAYFFPPRASIGSIRPKGLVKYLPRYGYEVTVVTVKLPGAPDFPCRVVETGFKHNLTTWVKTKITGDLSKRPSEAAKPLVFKFKKNSLFFKVMELVFGVLNYPDEFTGWVPIAVTRIKELCRNEQFEYILSTSSPVSGHLIASQVSRMTGIPWVADFRDLWTQNQYYPYGALRQFFEKKLEARTMFLASAFTTVSGPLASDLAAFHSKPVHVIPNGFDPEEQITADLTKKFSISHTGRLYDGKRDPASFLMALKELIDENIIDRSRLDVRFYGDRNHWLDMDIQKLGLTDIVHQYGFLDRAETLIKQRESQLLLLLGWDSPKDAGTCPGKFFEYLAAGRPVLSIGGPKGCVMESILKETNAGVHLPSDMTMIKTRLKELYAEFDRTGKVTYSGDQAAILKYSQVEMARKFADVFNSLKK